MRIGVAPVRAGVGGHPAQSPSAHVPANGRLGTSPREVDAMTLGPIVRFTYLAFELNAMLDRGCLLSIESTRRHVDDGTVFDWLDSQLESQPDLDGTPLDPQVRADILEVFRPLNDLDSLRHFGVEHNGVALLLAYCVEGIQQQEPLGP
jgi:hypothetical protein